MSLNVKLDRIYNHFICPTNFTKVVIRILLNHRFVNSTVKTTRLLILIASFIFVLIGVKVVDYCKYNSVFGQLHVSFDCLKIV